MVPAMLVLAVFAAVPVGVIVAYSFLGSEFSDIGSQLRFDHVRAVAESEIFWRLFARSWAMALAVCVTSLLIAVPVAHHIAYGARRPQLWLSLLLLPYLAGALPRILSLRTSFGVQGPLSDLISALGGPEEATRPLLFSTFGTLLGLLYAATPLTIFVLFVIFSRVDPRLLDASADLGASSWQRVRTVLLPMASRGLVAVCVVVGALSYGAYAEPALLGGGSGQMVGTVIGQRFLVHFEWAGGSALALVGAFAGLVFTTALALALLASHRAWRIVRG
jgi:ABC-type spermidine/putrescine transport system permease subunit I